MKKPIKVGLWGCGNRTQQLVEKTFATNKIDISLCADLNPEAADQAAEMYQAKTCPVDELLADDEIEVLLISLFPNAHAEALVQAAKTDKAIYIEKPVVTNWEEINKLRKVIPDSAYIHVGLMFRYIPIFKTLKELVDAGKIGTLVGVDFNWLSRTPSPENCPEGINNWRFHPSTGGELVQHFCHVFDWFQWLGGDFTRIFAMDNQLSGTEVPIEDTWNLLIEYASGAMLSFHSSMVNSRYTEMGWLEGTEGSLEFEWSKQTRIIHYTDKTRRQEGTQIAFNGEETDAFEDFLDRYQQGKPPYITLEDGFRSVIPAFLARESSAKGKALQF